MIILGGHRIGLIYAPHKPLPEYLSNSSNNQRLISLKRKLEVAGLCLMMHFILSSDKHSYIYIIKI